MEQAGIIIGGKEVTTWSEALKWARAMAKTSVDCKVHSRSWGLKWTREDGYLYALKVVQLMRSWGFGPCEGASPDMWDQTDFASD